MRRSFYKEPPYLPNKYGYEEIPPSLRAMNAGKVNAFCPSLLIIHKPAVNKWDFNDEKNHELLVKGIALPYAIKSMMYPKVALPFLKLAAKRRMKMYLKNVKDGETKVKEAARRFCEEYPIKEKIPLMQNIRFVWLFNCSILLQKYQVFGRKKKKGTAMGTLQLDFDAEHQYASPCRLQASLTRSTAQMRTPFCNKNVAEVGSRPLVLRDKNKHHPRGMVFIFMAQEEGFEPPWLLA